LDKDDFEYAPIFEGHGGWGKFKKVFEKDAGTIIKEINAAMAA
jgi:type I restriction enzyme, R subunit